MDQIRFLHNLFYEAKKEGGSLIGIACNRYSNLRRTFIFMIAALLNHEKGPLFQLFKSPCIFCSAGRKFLA